MYLRNPVRLSFVFVLLAVVACGQKGPLYLPGDASEMQPVVPEELGGSDEPADTEEPDGVSGSGGS